MTATQITPAQHVYFVATKSQKRPYPVLPNPKHLYNTKITTHPSSQQVTFYKLFVETLSQGSGATFDNGTSVLER